MSDEDEPLSHRHGSEDYSFSYDHIKKGYANVELLLRGKARIKEAMEIYGKICDNPAAAEAFMPENTVDRIKTHLSRLRLAARFWQKDPGNTDFQRDYARLAQMAYVDAADPLPVLDEVATVIKRHMQAMLDPDSSMGAVTGLSMEELERSYKTIDRIRQHLNNFSEDMRKISTIGNVGVGTKGNASAAQKFLGRVVKEEANPDFETEAMFFTISGLLHSEKDIIIEELAKVQPKEEADKLTHAFSNIAARISDYSKYAIDDPKRAVALMQADIPDCIEAFKVMKKQMNSTEYGTMDLLMECVESLRSEGHARSNSDPK